MADKETTLDTTINSIAPERLDAMKDSFFTELKESGSKHVEAATRFQAGLDKVIDVLLILVLKFGRATTMQLVNGGLNIACLVTLIIATVQITTLRSEVKDLMFKQEEFAKSQKRIEKTTSETQQDVATASQKVAETKAKVDDVAATAPKVELDTKTGKAKLVVQVPEKKKTKSVTPKITTAPGTAAAPPEPPKQRQVEINLE